MSLSGICGSRLLGRARGRLALLFGSAFVGSLGWLGVAAAAGPVVTASGVPAPVPAVAGYQFLSSSTTPPAETDRFSVGRRCFTPTSMQHSYHLSPLYAAGNEGQGATIAIIDSFGNPNMASDLANFNTQMDLPHMCGEPGQACRPGTPTFRHGVLEREDPGEGAAAEEQGNGPAEPQRVGA
jgi:subtilase family serine protease